MQFKLQIIQHSFSLLQGKIDLLTNTLRDLSDSAANETKRTAGDKHETALAMLQIEQENNNRQLNELLNQKRVLEQIDFTIQSTTIGKGSLVTTNKGIFFLSIGLGKLQIEGQQIIAVSIESPLGQQLAGRCIDDQFELNQHIYKILQID